VFVCVVYGYYMYERDDYIVIIIGYVIHRRERERLTNNEKMMGLEKRPEN
jgi:hypothetical protein